MIKKSSTFPLLAAVVTAWGVAAISATAQSSRPDLTGEWQLNRGLSEDAQAKFSSMGGGGGHHGGGGHGQGIEEIRNSLLNASTRLVVAQDDQKVVLTEADGHVRTLPTNNRTVKMDGREVRTKWENNRLVSETTIGDAKLVETYERSSGGRQLIVTVGAEMDGQQQMSVRRVYDPARK
jgi:hypothetical protein